MYCKGKACVRYVQVSCIRPEYRIRWKTAEYSKGFYDVLKSHLKQILFKSICTINGFTLREIWTSPFNSKFDNIQFDRGLVAMILPKVRIDFFVCIEKTNAKELFWDKNLYELKAVVCCT